MKHVNDRDAKKMDYEKLLKDLEFVLKSKTQSRPQSQAVVLS